jgi:tripartite-type tricarboxylate transporter receptor subunit TctC
MKLSRRHVVAALGAAPAAALLPRAAFAAYPDKTIHLIVPFAAGGNADIVGRLIGDAIAKNLKATVVVENRGGAGGGIGAQVVARAEPDGYTLLVASNGPMTVNPVMHANLGYDPTKDFAPVALTSYIPHALILTSAVSAKTVAEFVAASKTKPMNIATSGVGSATHMTLERFKAATGANITHVPYRGGGAMMPDIVSGKVDGAFTEFSTAVQMHKSGKARVVGIAATKRSALAPEIPTMIESGVKDFLAQSDIGIVAIATGLAGGATVDRLHGIGAEVATAEQITSAGFARFLKEDYAQVQEAAKRAGITPK